MLFFVVFDLVFEDVWWLLGFLVLIIFLGLVLILFDLILIWECFCFKLFFCVLLYVIVVWVFKDDVKVGVVFIIFVSLYDELKVGDCCSLFVCNIFFYFKKFEI